MHYSSPSGSGKGDRWPGSQRADRSSPLGPLLEGAMKGFEFGATYPTSKVAIYAMSSLWRTIWPETTSWRPALTPAAWRSETDYHPMKLLGVEAHPTPMAMPVKTVAYIVTCNNPMEQFAGRNFKRRLVRSGEGTRDPRRPRCVTG